MIASSILHTLSSLSVTDITGKRIINIVKKHTEDNNISSFEKHETLTTEIYFLPVDSASNEVLKLIKY